MIPRAILAIALLCCSCETAPIVEPSLPFTPSFVLHPQITRPRAKPSVAVSTEDQDRVLSDTAATRVRADCYVVSHGVTSRDIEAILPLAIASDKATRRLRAVKKGKNSRKEIVSARAAADALAERLPDDADCPPTP